MAEDKPLKKPLTDDQQDFLMDYLLEKYMDDLRKDEMRREDFYNQGPKTDPKGKPILSANMGGMISIDQMTSPLMMAEGGSPNQKLLDQIAKGGKNVSKMKVPTIRLNDNFRNILFESGFTKEATAKDVKLGAATKTGQKIGSFTAFNNHLGKINSNLTLFSNDPRTMVKVTNELNKVRTNLGLPKYRNVGITTPRSLFEQKQTDTGYAERGSKIPKEKVNKVTLQAQLEADKKFGVTEEGKKPTQKKLNFMAKFIKGKLGKKMTLASIITMLTKSGFGKTIPGLNVLSTAYDVGNISKAVGPDVIEKVQKGLDKVTEPVASKMTKAEDMLNSMFMSKMNQGGMMDINYMTRPLGYQEGTRDGELVGDRETANISKAMTGEAVESLRSLVAPQVLKKINDNTTTFPLAEIASMFLRDQGLETNEQNMGMVTNIIQNKLIPEEQDKLRDMGTDDLTKLIRGGFDMATTGKEKVSQGIQNLMDMMRRE